MTDTNQKLREALQKAKEALSLALSDVDWRKGSPTQPVMYKAYNCVDEALALPTADELNLSDPAVQKRLAAQWGHVLPTAEQVDDINVAESFTSVTKTAAPVCERDAFEHDLSKSPFEFDMDRWPDNAPVDWPGSYKQYHVQCAWDAWQARAALSAGDAVDAQRYRWLTDGKRGDWVWNHVLTEEVKGDHSRIECAIDAAMRKGQL